MKRISYGSIWLPYTRYLAEFVQEGKKMNMPAGRSFMSHNWTELSLCGEPESTSRSCRRLANWLKTVLLTVRWHNGFSFIKVNIIMYIAATYFSYATHHLLKMYTQTKFDDRIWNSTENTWYAPETVFPSSTSTFSLIKVKGQHSGRSDIRLVRDTQSSQDVPTRKLWWSYMK